MDACLGDGPDRVHPSRTSTEPPAVSPASRHVRVELGGWADPSLSLPENLESYWTRRLDLGLKASRPHDYSHKFSAILNPNSGHASVQWAFDPVCVHMLSSFSLTLCDPWAVAFQILHPWGFSRQEYWSGSPFLPPGDLPNPGIEPVTFMSPALAGGIFTTWQCCIWPFADRSSCQQMRTFQDRWAWEGERDPSRVQCVTRADLHLLLEACLVITSTPASCSHDNGLGIRHHSLTGSART